MASELVNFMIKHYEEEMKKIERTAKEIDVMGQFYECWKKKVKQEIAPEQTEKDEGS